MMGKINVIAGIMLAISANAWAANSAQFISQSIIHTVASGKSYAVSVTYKNTGDTTWTSNTFKLGVLDPSPQAQDPLANTQWNSGRVALAAGETVAPQATKTFNFTITAPASVNPKDTRYIQYQMVQEGVEWFGEKTPTVTIEVFYTPAITTNFPPNVAPVTASAADFTSANFLGANVLESETARPDGISGYIPTTDQMRIIANQARANNLNFLRMLVPLPTNGSSMTSLINAIRQDLDIAHAYGVRVIVALDGYDKYSGTCTGRQSFIAVDKSAAALVNGLYTHPAVYAWDLLNEPVWHGVSQNCTQVSPSEYQQIVDAVHAMYNVVRANDPSNKPTTVGEMQIPFVEYWKDISSFVSPHLYVNMGYASNNYPTMRGIVNAGLRELKRAASPKPVVIGEFGWPVPSELATESARSTAYANYYQETVAQGVGTMLWNMSLSQDQQPFSPLDTSGNWKPVGSVIGQQRPIARNAQFLSQSVPTTMLRGQSYQVSISVKNTGNTNWGWDGYKLGSQNPTDNLRWGVGRVFLKTSPSEIVLPGQTKTFTFNVTAPSTPGTYPFQWQMVQDGQAWFGALTPVVQVNVQ